MVNTVRLKKDTDVAHHNFNVRQPILVIFGTDVAERVCYQTLFPPHLTNVSALPGETQKWGNRAFQMLH